MNGCKIGAQKLKYMYLGRDQSVKKVCMKAIQKVHAFNSQLNFPLKKVPSNCLKSMSGGRVCITL